MSLEPSLNLQPSGRFARGLSPVMLSAATKMLSKACSDRKVCELFSWRKGIESSSCNVKKERTRAMVTRTGSHILKLVPPAGFEPAISTLKGWRPWPLDDGDSGKEYSRLFCRCEYRWQTGKPPHRSGLLSRFSNISICNIWAGKSALCVTGRDKRQASGRTSHSVTVRRLLTV